MFQIFKGKEHRHTHGLFQAPWSRLNARTGLFCCSWSRKHILLVLCVSGSASPLLCFHIFSWNFTCSPAISIPSCLCILFCNPLHPPQTDTGWSWSLYLDQNVNLNKICSNSICSHSLYQDLCVFCELVHAFACTCIHNQNNLNSEWKSVDLWSTKHLWMLSCSDRVYHLRSKYSNSLSPEVCR